MSSHHAPPAVTVLPNGGNWSDSVARWLVRTVVWAVVLGGGMLLMSFMPDSGQASGSDVEMMTFVVENPIVSAGVLLVLTGYLNAVWWAWERVLVKAGRPRDPGVRMLAELYSIAGMHRAASAPEYADIAMTVAGLGHTTLGRVVRVAATVLRLTRDVKLARLFGYSGWFALVMATGIGWLVLGFGNATYRPLDGAAPALDTPPAPAGAAAATPAQGQQAVWAPTPPPLPPMPMFERTPAAASAPQPAGAPVDFWGTAPRVPAPPAPPVG